jgi:toxin FitB
VNVVDSSAWLEYLVDSERASLFAEPIEQTQELIVPVPVIYELFKKVLRERGEQPAFEVYGLLSQANVVDVDASLATAAPASRQHNLCNDSTLQCDPLDTRRAFSGFAKSEVFSEIKLAVSVVSCQRVVCVSLIRPMRRKFSDVTFYKCPNCMLRPGRSV